MEYAPLAVEVFKRKQGFDFESVAILDVWKSVITQKNFKTKNTFEAVLLLNQETFDLMQTDAVLFINDCYYYIDSVICDDINTGLLKVSGKSLFGKTNQRIIYRIYNQTKRPELICYDHLKNEVVSPADSKRRLDFLDVEMPSSITTSSVQYQNSYGTVDEEIESLCESYDFGFDELPFKSSVGATIRFRKTVDRSSVVEFSAAFENIYEESFESSNYDEMTTALIYGEGEGTARKHTQINNELSGLERKELYVDARDLQQTVDDKKMTDAEYLAALKTRGKAKLDEHPAVLSLNGAINLTDSLFVYGKDYQLGDRVKRVSSFGISDTAVLNTVTETWDETGYRIDGEFGNQSKTILDIFKRR